MAARNADLIRTVYEDWARGEYPARPDLWAEHAELAFSDDFPDPASASDPDSRRRLFRSWMSAWESWQMTAEEVVEEGDFVLVLNIVRGRGKGSAIGLEATGAHLWELRGGKVVRLTIYRDQERARRELADRLAARS